MRTGGHGETDGCTRRSTVFDVFFEVESGLFWFASGKDQINNIGFNFIIDIDFINGLPGTQDLFWCDDGLYRRGRFGVCHSVENKAFFFT